MKGRFDHRYLCPDFDFSIIKQLKRQCMLIFCDLELTYICHFFGLGVYFMFGGGLCRDGFSNVTKPFIYSYLHKHSREYVAKRMTKNIHDNIRVEKESWQKIGCIKI